MTNPRSFCACTGDCEGPRGCPAAGVKPYYEAEDDSLYDLIAARNSMKAEFDALVKRVTGATLIRCDGVDPLDPNDYFSEPEIAYMPRDYGSPDRATTPNMTNHRTVEWRDAPSRG